MESEVYDCGRIGIKSRCIRWSVLGAEKKAILAGQLEETLAQRRICRSVLRNEKWKNGKKSIFEAEVNSGHEETNAKTFTEKERSATKALKGTHQLPQSLLDNNKSGCNTGWMLGHSDVQLIGRQHATHIGKVAWWFIVNVGVIIIGGGGCCKSGNVQLCLAVRNLEDNDNKNKKYFEVCNYNGKFL